MARGKKKCPGCSEELGLRTYKCPKCGYDFTASKKVSKAPVLEEKKQDVAPSQPVKKSYFERVLSKEHGRIEYSDLVYLTPQEHADRILGYGKERASILFNLHKWQGGWNHVDWKRVEEGLKVA